MATNEELVVAIQSGEREKLKLLWSQVERFVRKQVYRRHCMLGDFGGATMDDLYQSGYLALVAAVDTYDPERGMSFIGWLRVALKTSFAEAGGYRSSRKNPLDCAESLDEPFSGDGGDGGTLAHVIATPENPIADVEEKVYNEQLRAALDAALRQLPVHEEAVIRARYYQGRTLREIGPRAHNLEKQALDRLRRLKTGTELRRFIGPSMPCRHRAAAPADRVALERERLVQKNKSCLKAEG